MICYKKDQDNELFRVECTPEEEKLCEEFRKKYVVAYDYEKSGKYGDDNEYTKLEEEHSLIDYEVIIDNNKAVGCFADGHELYLNGKSDASGGSYDTTCDISSSWFICIKEIE